ncbi:MAG: methyltransferase, partial [Betaproteobacteria bacterium]
MIQPTTNDSAGVIAPAPVFFGVAIAAGYLLERLVPTSLASLANATVVGAGLIAVSIALVASAVTELMRAKTAFDATKSTTHIVTSEAFRISRNPTYLSLALLQLGLTFFFQSFWLLATGVAAVGVTHWGVILREERYLERKF